MFLIYHFKMQYYVMLDGVDHCHCERSYVNKML